MSELIKLTEPAWLKQQGESNRWYDRFHRYMLAGSKRSLLGTYRVERAELGVKRRTLKTPGAWDRAFARFHWRDRAAAWDEHQRNINQADGERRYRELRESAWEMSEKLLEHHNKMRTVPLFEQEITATDSSGNPTAVTISPFRWAYRDIIATAQAAIELGAFAIGDVEAAIHLIESIGYNVSLPSAPDVELSKSID